MEKQKTFKPLRFRSELFKSDVKNFGREVAIYNQGWLRGFDKAAKKFRGKRPKK